MMVQFGRGELAGVVERRQVDFGSLGLTIPGCLLAQHSNTRCSLDRFLNRIDPKDRVQYGRGRMRLLLPYMMRL